MPPHHFPSATEPLAEHRTALISTSAALGAVGLYATGRLLHRTLAERDEALRQTRVLTAAASELNATLDPEQVIATGVRLAAAMASPKNAKQRRANYCMIDGGTVRVADEFDTAGSWLGATWPLSEHPHLAEVVRTRTARSGRLDPETLGPTVRALSQSQRVGHAAWVPVVVAGDLHGVLAVAGRGRPITDRELSRTAAIARIMELALSNALTHQDLKRTALTDPLTSLPNRRGLDDLVRERRGRLPVAVLAIDIDELKRVNDSDGHAAGDTMLVTVADAIAGVLRAGDIVARIGGDEFLCVLFASDIESAVQVAERTLDAVDSAHDSYHTPRVSIGVTFSSPHEPLEQAVRRADMAMYSAKQDGGMRYKVAQPAAVPGPVDRDAAA